MADEPAAKKKSPLYDAPKGQPKSGARAEKPEKKPEPEPKAEPAKDEGGDKQPKNDNGTAKAEAPKDQTGDKGAGKDGEVAKPKDDRAEMHRRHETERRDFHGNMREAMRQMTQRHEKEIKALNEKGAGVAQPIEKVPGNEPEKPQAQAVAAAAPVE